MVRTAIRIAILLLAIAVLANRRALVDAAIATPVQLDVVAVDAQGQTVGGLAEADFQVREDGHAVTIDSVDEIGSSRSAAERIVVVMLDDTGVRAPLTTRVQDIARQFVGRVSPGDRLNVVRFNDRGDEAVGDRAIALSRIADYTAGRVPFFGRETIENALQRVQRLSRTLANIRDRRKEIVAIGSPGVFDVPEPIRGRASLIWSDWVGALSAASDANASVYVIDPEGITGRVKLTGAPGLVADTGGLGFYNSADFAKAVEQVWRDAGHYYLVSYTPLPMTRELHDVDVKVSRPGIHVRARRVRG